MKRRSDRQLLQDWLSPNLMDRRKAETEMMSRMPQRAPIEYAVLGAVIRVMMEPAKKATKRKPAKKAA